MSSNGRPASRVGQVLSLAPLGHGTTGTVLAQGWSPALGEILRVRGGRPGQPAVEVLLYGDLLRRALAAADA